MRSPRLGDIARRVLSGWHKGIERAMGTTESSAVLQHETREYILEMISELASLALRCGETRIALALDEILSETNPGLPRG